MQQQIDAGRIRDVSVYYRDLLDGPWFGINESVEYNPASMMKVPVMVAEVTYLKLFHEVMYLLFIEQ